MDTNATQTGRDSPSDIWTQLDNWDEGHGELERWNTSLPLGGEWDVGVPELAIRSEADQAFDELFPPFLFPDAAGVQIEPASEQPEDLFPVVPFLGERELGELFTHARDQDAPAAAQSYDSRLVLPSPACAQSADILSASSSRSAVARARLSGFDSPITRALALGVARNPAPPAPVQLRSSSTGTQAQSSAKDSNTGKAKGQCTAPVKAAAGSYRLTSLTGPGTTSAPAAKKRRRDDTAEPEGNAGGAEGSTGKKPKYREPGRCPYCNTGYVGSINLPQIEC